MRNDYVEFRRGIDQGRRGVDCELEGVLRQGQRACFVRDQVGVRVQRVKAEDIISMDAPSGILQVRAACCRRGEGEEENDRADRRELAHHFCIDSGAGGNNNVRSDATRRIDAI